MNLVVLCSGCGAVFRILQGDSFVCGDVDALVGSRSEFWPANYVCPKCGAQAAGSHEEALPRAMHTAAIVDMLPEEFYAALHGLGMPDERVAVVAEVREALTRSPVLQVVGTDIPGTKRCTLDYIVLKDGTRIYFGASSQGAVVYRLVQPISYVDRVLSEEE